MEAEVRRNKWGRRKQIQNKMDEKNLFSVTENQKRYKSINGFKQQNNIIKIKCFL